MKKIAFLVVAAIMATLRVGAWEATTTEMNFRQLAEPKLTVPTMELKSNYGPTSYYYRPELDVRLEDHKPWAKENWTWMRSNEGVKPYKFMDDITFAGIPVFVAGWLIKGEKASFRQDYKNKHSNTRLITNFKTGIDDYTQFFGPALTVGLKAGGYEGRSDWGRLLGSSLMSYAIMAGFVNGIKYTASEMRPDGSTANSWPSGHTATSFVGATILHKEYGLTRSPWFSVAGYGMATATGVMRILNNRHWISDVLSGAGIGIMSTELGYALGDLLFKDRGLLRNDLQNFSENPSFFAISMGLSFGSKSLGFNGENLVTNLDDQFDDDEENEQVDIDFHTATSVDAEGAYFFNKYIGIGGRLRVRAMTAKGWSNFIGWAHEDRDLFVDYVKDMYQLFPSSTSMKTNEEIDRELSDIITDEEITVESDHLTEFSANVGLYLNLPLSNRFALGTKFLIGRTMTQELDINAAYKGTVKRMDTHIVIDNNEVQDLSISNLRNGDKYDVEWDYLTLGGNNSTTYGTGLSLTYKHKSNFMWRVFVDYDYSKKEFELTYDPLRFLKLTTPDLSALFTTMNTSLDPYIYKKEKKMHYFTIGASFAISF